MSNRIQTEYRILKAHNTTELQKTRKEIADLVKKGREEKFRPPDLKGFNNNAAIDENKLKIEALAKQEENLLAQREKLRASADELGKALSEEAKRLSEFKSQLNVARRVEERNAELKKAAQEKLDRERGIAANDRIQARFQKQRDKKEAQEKRDRERGIAFNDRLQAKFRRNRQKLESEAEGFRRGFRTPLENLKIKLQDIDRLAKRGFLNPNEAARAENQAVDAFRKSELGKLKPNTPPPLPGLATQGSAEAARALARFRASGLVKNTKQNPNKNLEAINKQVLAVLKEIQVGLQEDEDQVVNVFGE